MKALLAVILPVLIGIHGNAQYKFEYLTTKDGLSANRIRCMFRDSKGYLWIGTEYGLDRYDGYKIKTYRHSEKQAGSLSNSNITTICEDHDRNLWIGTSDGLNLYLPERDSFKVFRNSPTDVHSIDENWIYDLFKDNKGNFWITTHGKCLNKWMPATEQFMRYPIGNHRGASSLSEDSKGNLWLVSEYLPGVYRFNLQTGKLTNYATFTLSLKSKGLYIDRDDKIWLTPRGEGLLCFDPSTGKLEQYVSNGNGKGTNGKLINGIIEVDDRYLWIGVDQGGINCFDKATKTFEYIMHDEKEDDGLNNNGIWYLHKDKEGIIWVCTSGGGINIYNPQKKKFMLFRHNSNNPNTVSSNIIGCFCEDSQGMIWIGTDNKGLDAFNPKTGIFKSFKHDPANRFSISSNTIRCIAEDESKDLWIGTWSKGFNHFVRKANRFYCYLPDVNNPSSLSGPTVWHFIIDHKGLFWLAIHDVGVDLFDKRRGVIKRFVPDPNNPQALSNAKVWYIFEDSHKNIWLGTDNGLNLYDSINNSFTVYKQLPSKNIKAITEDKDKNLWLGTEKGICQIKTDGAILQVYDELNGLAGNIVHGVVCDNMGNLWISTNNGISNFDPKTKTFKNYTENEGLQDNSFFQESFLKTREGEIYFGGFKGFNSFFPGHIKVNTTVPPVYINEFQIFNRPVAWGTKDSPLQKHISETKEITLAHLQSVFSFGFIAINYTNPEKNIYAYKMEGFDREWNYTDAQRRYVTYTNLNPGKYIFRVKACNNDGVWNDTGASVKVIILPPWWNTVWFKLGALLVLVVSVYAGYYVRLDVYRKTQKKLSQLVKDRTSEIANANDILLERQSRIEEYAEELRCQTENLREANELLLEKQKLVELQTIQLNESNQQLVVLNSTKDRFFSIIAHDLRNPLQTISGFAEILNSDYQKLSPEKIEKFHSLIYSSSVGINSLLENLLQWARAQTGSIAFAPKRVNLLSVAEETLDPLQCNIQKKNITIRQFIDSSTIVKADENMLKTIFRNLISNAIKFSHENGFITLKSDIVDSGVQITVADTGMGIPAETLSLLFRIDAKVTTKGTEDEAGTGLGLILCKEFVERHNGRIWVESIEGKGSQFMFIIPMI